MAVLTGQRTTNEVLMPRLGARTHLEYTWAHVVKVHTVPPCEVRRGAPAPSPAVRAEGPHLPAPSFTLGGAKGSTPTPGVPGPVRTGGGGASTVCGVDCHVMQAVAVALLQVPLDAPIDRLTECFFSLR